MLKKIWERYIFFNSVRTFLFFLASFYVVFIIIDFSTQSVRFYSETTPTILRLLTYYLYQFVKYLDVFFPLTFLFTIIKVFTDMNTKNELVALQTAGLSAKTLTRPLFYFAFILIALGYMNYEFLLPRSMGFITEFRNTHKKDAAKDKAQRKIHVVPLQNGTKLVYSRAKPEIQKLDDVYWIQKESVWHFKTLDLGQQIPLATFADQFKKSEDKKIEKVASYREISFPEIQLIEDYKEYMSPIDGRSLSHLILQWWKNKFFSEDERNDVITHINYRLASPFFCLLIFLSCVPYTMKFSRHIPLFIITSTCLFGFILFYTIMDAAFILSENQVLRPFLSIWIPYILGFIFSTWNFARHA